MNIRGAPIFHRQTVWGVVSSHDTPKWCPTAKLAAECSIDLRNHSAKQLQTAISPSAQTKSLCQEGLCEYAILHALQPHCLRCRQRLERGGDGSWSLVAASAQAARGRHARRAPGTRARPSASAAGQLANAAVPRDSVAAVPPHGATVASLLPSSARSSRRLREHEGRYV